MELLERTWEGVGNFFGGLLQGFERGVTAVFGSSNARYIRRLQTRVESISALESRYQAMSDAELREQTAKFKERLKAGETLEDILVEAFAVCREGGRRYLGMRHFDVQLIGGMVLHTGSIAEMVTGEGKTLVATLPAYLNALEGKGVHVVTVNDYLARRDMEWMGPLYLGLGLTVGAIQSDMAVDERQAAYACDITYGTNNEFGFDYLRDNMRPAARGDHRYPKHLQQSQGKLNFAIIDEVDNILIDEARTPLIISGPAFDNPGKYKDADRIARMLTKEKHFVVNEKDHVVNLTDDGVREAEKLAGVESFYTAGHMEWPHLIDNALKAHHLYQKDVRYVVEGGKVIIVDEFTGRKMEGRQWSDGLHQAVEAKEGVPIKEETQTLATITLQNFFKLYGKICGMTGTAMTEAGEFWKIYQLDVVAIPTNKPLRRVENPDVIYRSEPEKFIAVADEIERMNKYDVLVMNSNGDELAGTILRETDSTIEFQAAESRQRDVIDKSDVKRIERKGRPVLVGTVSIEKSERLAGLLDKRGIKHEVLNAKYHKREAEIVAQAGRLGAVTIATNMAGRGTDIILGGNPETMAWAQLQAKYPTRLDVPPAEWDALVRQIEEKEQMKAEGMNVRELGGLHVIGTERHEARRIDLQLRGRTGRQGDPGSSRFFLSLEDDLMRIFAGPWVKSILESLGMKEGEKIESRMVTRRIAAAQKKVEERHFEARKNLLEYDEVMDEQRKRVYGFRQRILEGGDCREAILDMIRKQIDKNVGKFMERDFGSGQFAAYASKELACEFEPRDFRGLTFDEAVVQAKSEAERAAATHVFDAIEENLPGDEGDEEAEAEWNWEALARGVNSRWKLNLRDRDLKRIPREELSEYLIDLARKSIEERDLSEGQPFLEDDFHYRWIVGWVQHKFGIEMKLDEIRGKEVAAVKQHILEKAAAAYDRREAEYPVMVGLYRFADRAQGGRLDREGFIAWSRERFEVAIDLDDLKSKQRDEVRALLVHHSRKSKELADQTAEKVRQKVADLFGQAEARRSARQAGASRGSLEAMSQWAKENLRYDLTADEISDLDRQTLETKLINAVEERYRPEMRRMERALLLQIVDQTWKDHLLAMDHLRSSVAFVGYAQVDPKVEYKREGMKLFEQMWDVIERETSDLIFKMESLDEGFVSSTWKETSAVHESPPPTEDLARSQEQTNAASQADLKVETIRNRGPRVGRNDPCPCGSGKKYKHCHMRMGRDVA